MVSGLRVLNLRKLLVWATFLLNKFSLHNVIGNINIIIQNFTARIHLLLHFHTFSILLYHIVRYHTQSTLPPSSSPSYFSLFSFISSPFSFSFSFSSSPSHPVHLGRRRAYRRWRWSASKGRGWAGKCATPTRETPSDPSPDAWTTSSSSPAIDQSTNSIN